MYQTILATAHTSQTYITPPSTITLSALGDAQSMAALQIVYYLHGR